MSKEKIPAEVLKAELENTATGEKVSFGSVLKKRTVVTLLRRFGCLLCRQGAAHLSSIKADLDKDDIALIALGIEKLGLDEFKQGRFFDGPIYLDENRQVYQALGTSRSSVFSLLKPSVSSSIVTANLQGFGGNITGDGMQLGGTFVLDSDGSIVYAHRQTHFGDHPDPKDVLAAAQGQKIKPSESKGLGEADLSKASQTVDDIINTNRITVFSLSSCPFCARAKALLSRKKTEFFAVELDKRPDGPAIQSVLQGRTGRSTLPNVFVNGKSLGGADDLDSLDSQGLLDQHLYTSA